MAKRAFRFGVVTGGHPSRSSWIALAQRVEELGYSSLLLPDVLGTPLATITALAVAATATTQLRVGSYVFVNDYRNPALLAREIATRGSPTPEVHMFWKFVRKFVSLSVTLFSGQSRVCHHVA